MHHKKCRHLALSSLAGVFAVLGPNSLSDADAGQQSLETADDDVGWEDAPDRSHSHPQEGTQPDAENTVIAPEMLSAAEEERPEALSESGSADQGGFL